MRKFLVSFVSLALVLAAFFFLLTACGGGGGGGDENAGGGAAPAAPTGVVVTVISSTQLRAVWNVVPGAAFYRVYLDGGLIATVPSATMDLFLLTPSTPYCVSVTALTEGLAESAPSAPVCVTTQAALRVLREVGISYAASMGTSWEVIWDGDAISDVALFGGAVYALWSTGDNHFISSYTAADGEWLGTVQLPGATGEGVRVVADKFGVICVVGTEAGGFTTFDLSLDLTIVAASPGNFLPE